MHTTRRPVVAAILALLGAVVVAVGSALTAAGALAASTTYALIMGGTGRPNPADFPGYMENVTDYYIDPNTPCAMDPTCTLEQVSVYTPETAWPLYGGAGAQTWQDSILTGVELYDQAVQARRATLGADDRIVLFGYSQSGEIVALEKIRLAGLSDEEKAKISIVVIGNSSRPNGGINSRAYPFALPVVEFPFGPAMPTDTGIETADIAFKWDIIADAPTYITNPLAILNGLLGFWYVHGTMPDPTPPDSPENTIGGYTVEQWQAMMDDPENEAFQDIITVQTFGDTKYITVTPTVLPLVIPLHNIGLTPLADLIEPALRVIIEHTGYDRSIPFGEPTMFKLIPLFNPITLVVDLVPAIGAGFSAFLADLGLGVSASVSGPEANQLTPPAAHHAPQATAETAPSALTRSTDTVTEVVETEAISAPEPESSAVDPGPGASRQINVIDEAAGDDSSGGIAALDESISEDMPGRTGRTGRADDEQNASDDAEQDTTTDSDDTVGDKTDSSVPSSTSSTATNTATNTSGGSASTTSGGTTDSTTSTGSDSDKAAA